MTEKEEEEQKHSKPRRIKVMAWCQLLISFLVPVAIAVYTFVENRSDQAIALANREKDLQIAREQRQQDLQIADDQQKAMILASYENFLVEHLNEYGMTLNGSDSARYVARLKTLTTVSQLDPIRKSFLLQALYEAHLIRHHVETTKPLQSGTLGLEQANLSYVSLNDRYLKYLTLPDSYLQQTSFVHSDISCVNFHQAILHYANFSGTFARALPEQCFPLANSPMGTIFRRSKMHKSVLMGAQFMATDFTDVTLDDSDMSGFVCITCKFSSSSMVRVNLTRAEMLGNGQFDLVNFTEAIMHLTSVKLYSFTKALLYRTMVSQSLFESCSFHQTNFTDSRSIQSLFSHSNFSESSFVHAHFRGSQFINVTLSHLSMSGIDLTDVTFIQSNFVSVNFNGSRLFNTKFVNCSFQNTSIPET